MVKYIISGVLGAAGGSIVTYLIMKKRFERRLELEYRQFQGSSTKGAHPYFESQEEASEGVTAVPETRSKTTLDGGPVFEGQRTDYSAMAKNYTKSIDDIMAESEAPEEALSEQEDQNPIHIISPNEYNADSETERTDLYWYPESNVLEDEYGEEVEEREKLVGDCLEELRAAEVMPVDDEGLIFIRNNNIGCIYAVEVMYGKVETGE